MFSIASNVWLSGDSLVNQSLGFKNSALPIGTGTTMSGLLVLATTYQTKLGLVGVLFGAFKL